MDGARLLNAPVNNKWITILMILINFRFLFDYLHKNIQKKTKSNTNESMNHVPFLPSPSEITYRSDFQMPTAKVKLASKNNVI